jgi:hypothetical protein
LVCTCFGFGSRAEGFPIQQAAGPANMMVSHVGTSRGTIRAEVGQRLPRSKGKIKPESLGFSLNANVLGFRLEASG